jgi:hypothetical protein
MAMKAIENGQRLGGSVWPKKRNGWPGVMAMSASYQWRRKLAYRRNKYCGVAKC